MFGLVPAFAFSVRVPKVSYKVKQHENGKEGELEQSGS